jgi:hypothetical protein
MPKFYSLNMQRMKNSSTFKFKMTNEKISLIVLSFQSRPDDFEGMLAARWDSFENAAVIASHQPIHHDYSVVIRSENKSPALILIKIYSWCEMIIISENNRLQFHSDCLLAHFSRRRSTRWRRLALMLALIL